MNNANDQKPTPEQQGVIKRSKGDSIKSIRRSLESMGRPHEIEVELSDGRIACVKKEYIQEIE